MPTLITAFRFLLSKQGEWIDGQLSYGNGGYPKCRLPRLTAANLPVHGGHPKCYRPEAADSPDVAAVKIRDLSIPACEVSGVVRCSETSGGLLSEPRWPGSHRSSSR